MRYKKHQDCGENNKDIRKFWGLVLLGLLSMTCSNSPIEDSTYIIDQKPIVLILLYAITIAVSFYYIIFRKR